MGKSRVYMVYFTAIVIVIVVSKLLVSWLAYGDVACAFAHCVKVKDLK